MEIQKQKFSHQRWAALAVGGIAGMVFTMQVGAQLLLGVLAGTALFLGITDFGRQCPLLISLRQVLVRIRKKIIKG